MRRSVLFRDDAGISLVQSYQYHDTAKVWPVLQASAATGVFADTGVPVPSVARGAEGARRQHPACKQVNKRANTLESETRELAKYHGLLLQRRNGKQ